MVMRELADDLDDEEHCAEGGAALCQGRVASALFNCADFARKPLSTQQHAHCNRAATLSNGRIPFVLCTVMVTNGRRGSPKAHKTSVHAQKCSPTDEKAAGGTRTHNLEITNHALYQLSYGGVACAVAQ